MNDEFTHKLPPEDQAVSDVLQANAQSIQVNAHFQSSLEARLKEAHTEHGQPEKRGLHIRIIPAIGWAILAIGAFLVLNWAVRSLVPTAQPAAGDATPSACPVTEPNDSLPPGVTSSGHQYLGNGQIWTSIWPDGKVIMGPENIQPDGSYNMEWYWWRGVTGPLTVEGRRLDAEAGPLRAEIIEGHDDTGFQLVDLSFPTTGCWEVTAQVGEASLTFVGEVIFSGDLPYPPPVPTAQASPIPEERSYEWRGTKLYLNAALPDTPQQASVFTVQDEQPATLDSVRALAGQFGMNGNIYETPSEMSNSETPNFLVVDGNQRLQVRSNLYFSYYPDYTRWIANSTFERFPDQAAAEETISAFLNSHGFDFTYKVELSEMYGGYCALPLTPDGFAIQHEHFKFAGLLFRFDDNGIVAVEANLTDYAPVKNVGVISAESALQKILDPNTVYGIQEGMHAGNHSVQDWNRPRPENQTITVWGWISSVKSAEGGAPLVTFDGYRATGNLVGLAESTPNTFVETTGQFQTVDGVKTFNVESWQVYEGHEEGLQGTIQRDGDQTTIATVDGNALILPDIPADMPLPLEDAFVLGVTRGDVFEWKSIDTRMQGGGGGGGGGGGSGFYKPNLSGTPVPLPTPQVLQNTNPGSGDYVVQAGDTLSGIAETYSITVDELMQANGLTDSTIYIGQTLVIPGAHEETSLIGQTLDGQRGMLTVTITNKLDGSQSVDYRLQIEETGSRYQLMRLEGSALDELQTHNNLPVDIWGTIERFDTDLGMSMPVVNVERFEIPYPELQYQIFKGTQSITTVQGETITLFTTEDGQTYAQANGYGDLIGHAGDQVLMEALVLPDKTIDGYPVLQVVSASMAINPKSGQPVEMQVTANQPYVINESEQRPIPTNPTASIENIKLVYFTPDTRYTIPDPNAGPTYLQPVWRFSGHYSNGDEFEILVQALKEEFLLPEIETIQPPG